MSDFDGCTCDPEHAVRVDCEYCERSNREREQRESLRLLAALVDAFNLALVAWWREREERRWAMHAAMGYELTEDEMNAIVDGEG